MRSNLKSPVYVQVEITSVCNNNCIHCYNFWRYENKHQRKELSIVELKKIANVLGKNDIFYVTVTGGEPFVDKEKLYKFLDFLCEQNIRITINSNGTLLDKQDGIKLSDYPIEIFLVSLISNQAKIHDKITQSNLSFAKTIKGITILRKYGINTAINMVALNLNYNQVYSTGKWIYDEFGITSFSALQFVHLLKNIRGSNLINGKYFLFLNNF